MSPAQSVEYDTLPLTDAKITFWSTIAAASSFVKYLINETFTVCPSALVYVSTIFANSSWVIAPSPWLLYSANLTVGKWLLSRSNAVLLNPL